MNYADARQIMSLLERHGYRQTSTAEEADVIVLETCTVRQQAEDKAYGKLTSLIPLKRQENPPTIAVMGCLVGVKGNKILQEKYPFVDVFMPPHSDGSPLLSHLQRSDAELLEEEATATRHSWQDEGVILPMAQRGKLVSAPVSVVYGCSHACSFCIIPFRRGVEKSRSVGEIVAEVRSLVAQGVKEVTLLGQIVDRYGKDIPDGPDLPALLRQVHQVEGLSRIRFLTSHPNWMSKELLEMVAELPKVMPHIEVPAQSGDDQILRNMKRGYTAQQYRELIKQIRTTIPDVAIHGDIIVGFPGETDQQFQHTYDMLAELRLDKIHLARYSPRTGTVSARRMGDDVPDGVKRARWHKIDALQKEITQEKTNRYLGETVEILVEGLHKGRWRGRTAQNKLVFFDDTEDWLGKMAPITVSWAGPYSMSGELANQPATPPIADSIPLMVMG